jgi:bifunctional oligoribonuclease and PAP phosphatase NrnA
VRSGQVLAAENPRLERECSTIRAMFEEVKKLVAAARRIVVIQAENPDADSLGSALALEQILGDMDKEPSLYCAVDMPGYLKHMAGWDRVSNELPAQFDASIIVDASTITLFEKLTQTGYQSRLAGKPCIVLDHHGSVANEIPFATVTVNDPKRSSTGELIYALASDSGWPLSVKTMEFLMSAILGDTQGLSNNLASAETYRVMAGMIEAGVDRPKLEELRRAFTKMPPAIFKYKADLIKRTEFHADGQLAIVDVPQAEISQYSPLYNPAPLIQTDMLQTEGVGVAVVLKHYSDGKVTAAIRCNATFAVGDKLAEHFGGGGHPYASGFKVTDGRPFNELKSECISYASSLLTKLKQDKPDETTQYAHTTG